jgi:transposase
VKHKGFDKEFKEAAVRLVKDEGMSATKVAKELGVSQASVSTWVRESEEHGKDAFPGKGNLHGQEQEIRRLQRELARVKMERDILKKAITFFRDEER